jgi:hypothetical protein
MCVRRLRVAAALGGGGFARGPLALLCGCALMCASGCGHEPRAGETLGAIGIVTASLGVAVATDCPAHPFEPDDHDPPQSCDYDEGDGDADAGLPLMAIGFGLVGVGALLTAMED